MVDHYVEVPGGSKNNNYANIDVIVHVAEQAGVPAVSALCFGCLPHYGSCGIIQEASSVATQRSMTFNTTCSVTNLLTEANKCVFKNLSMISQASSRPGWLEKHPKAANGESLAPLLEPDKPPSPP
ncbi:uncharacterized protein VP01_2561g1 [Puccinia sorghi]|uniref:Uncharacterized protein n=1 Tax=Puccinia sorghi TaxID=27349 RepID=A0A0L6V6X4_9BASI|nr:uncharacterized protein VP01_2561g1 [Puccinia sorghi]